MLHITSNYTLQMLCGSPHNVCNEEAKLDGLELNRGLYDDEGNMYDVICGRFIVVGLTEDNFGSLTEEQMIRYKEMYKMPEAFVLINGKLQAYDAHTVEKAFSFAEKMIGLSISSGYRPFNSTTMARRSD